MNKYLLSILLAALSITASAAHADSMSTRQPESFKYSGVIDEVNYGDHTIVVEKHRVQLSETAVVHDHGKTGSIRMLHAGQLVGCSPSKNSWDGATVTDVWVLTPGRYEYPPGAQRPAVTQ